MQELKNVITFGCKMRRRKPLAWQTFRKAKGLEAALKVILTNNQGKNLMDDCTGTFRTWKRRKKTCLVKRVDEEKVSVWTAKVTIFLTTAAAFADRGGSRRLAHQCESQVTG